MAMAAQVLRVNISMRVVWQEAGTTYIATRLVDLDAVVLQDVGGYRIEVVTV